MHWVDSFKEVLPEYAKDTKLNLDAVIKRSTLDPVEAQAVALAAAMSTGNGKLVTFISSNLELAGHAVERDAAMTLMNQGVDVLAFHTGSNAVMVAAQERGHMAIAYHSDMRKVAPEAQLLAVTHHWGEYYSQRVRALAQGRWQSTDTWGGVREGMVRIEGFGPKLSPAVRQEVLARQTELAQGRLKIFQGPLLDERGQMVLPAGQVMTDAQIKGMNFKVQGVRSM